MENLDQAYQQALDYLYSFIDYSLTRNLRFAAEKFNLDRMFALLKRLGNPQHVYHVIHVAGTKGKGSVSALLASALRAAGYKTGLYTSPHLQEYTERIQIDGQEIPPADLVTLIEEVKPHVAQIPELTTFEITTALGFLYFARQHVNAAVIEVGLGGRLDATNVITPLVSVITSLSYDHMAVLGNTLTEIATEKAGIIKPGRPVVLAPQPEEARLAVERIAAERGSFLTRVGLDFHTAPGVHDLEGQSFSVWGLVSQAPVELHIPLLGLHQVENAATAYAALKIADQDGLPVSDAAIRAGFDAVRWPGRFELLQREPPVLVDSAHNRDSALRLRQALDDYLPDRPVILIFGASEDKDVAGMFAELLPRVEQVIATQSIHPRAMPPAQIVQLAVQSGKPARATISVEEALALGQELAGGRAALVVTGSLFVAAAARHAWFQFHPQR